MTKSNVGHVFRVQHLITLHIFGGGLVGENDFKMNFPGENFLRKNFVGENFIGDDFVGENFLEENSVGETSLEKYHREKSCLRKSYWGNFVEENHASNITKNKFKKMYISIVPAIDCIGKYD